MSRDTIKKIF